MVLAADLMRNAANTVAELMDRQCLLLLDPRRGGLPANLAPPDDLRRHGLKAVGIAMSALAAEIAHFAAPVAPHSRPNESMNQDIVSMGTIAARRSEHDLSHHVEPGANRNRGKNTPQYQRGEMPFQAGPNNHSGHAAGTKERRQRQREVSGSTLVGGKA